MERSGHARDRSFPLARHPFFSTDELHQPDEEPDEASYTRPGQQKQGQLSESKQFRLLGCARDKHDSAQAF